MRWKALITYRRENDQRLVELFYLIELDEIQDIVERGPHFDTIIDIKITRINHVEDKNLTLEKAESL